MARQDATLSAADPRPTLPPRERGASSMVTRAEIDDFLAQKNLALVGVSRDGKAGFGNVIRRELGPRGYTFKLVHPHVDSIAGQPCAHHLKDVATDVGGVVLVTPPAATLPLVQEAA